MFNSLYTRVEQIVLKTVGGTAAAMDSSSEISAEGETMENEAPENSEEAPVTGEPENEQEKISEDSVETTVPNE